MSKFTDFLRFAITAIPGWSPENLAPCIGATKEEIEGWLNEIGSPPTSYQLNKILHLIREGATGKLEDVEVESHLHSIWKLPLSEISGLEPPAWQGAATLEQYLGLYPPPLMYFLTILEQGLLRKALVGLDRPQIEAVFRAAATHAKELPRNEIGKQLWIQGE